MRNFYAALDLGIDGVGLYGPFDKEDAEKLAAAWSLGPAGVLQGVSGDIPACYPFGMEDDGIDPKKYG